MSFKKVAWNGVFLDIPQSWEAGFIGDRYLVFENGAKPVMEIKWQPVKGKFSTKTHFKRLAGIHGRRKKAVRPWQPPPSWISALTGRHVEGFQWREKNDSGRGVILWCPHCQTASLIQFLGDSGEEGASIQPEILARFGDHRNDRLTAWSLFDIRMMIPEAFQLSDFAFIPGSYRFSFKNGHISLTLWRWAPAAALLADQGLTDFAAVTLNKNTHDFHDVFFDNHPAVEWKSQMESLWRRLGPRSGPRHDAGCVWHVESRNRILGVHILGKKPPEDNLLDSLCSSFIAI
jgi:hypothetical protein